jgi:hypothetical protein
LHPQFPIRFPHPQEQCPQSQPQADFPCRRLRTIRHTANPATAAIATINITSNAFMIGLLYQIENTDLSGRLYDTVAAASTPPWFPRAIGMPVAA